MGELSRSCRACHKNMFLDFKVWGVFFVCLFIEEMDPKDEILPCKRKIRLSYYNVTTRLVDLIGLCWFLKNNGKNMLG